MRKLASIRKITKLEPIVGADMIETATVDGWKVVVKKGEFQVNSPIIYFEIDSWIPHNIAPFLSKGNPPREYNNILGERLKTIKLKGQISQGLILPISILNRADFKLGDDVSEELNIHKYEPPIPAQLAGICKSTRPSFVPKTDQERTQNIFNDIDFSVTWEVSEKMEGSSMSVYYNDGEFGVTSRNIDLLETDHNTFW